MASGLKNLVTAGLVPTESERKALLRRIEDVGGVEAILVRYAEGDSLQQLATAFGCRPTQISAILRAPAWKDKFEHAKKLKAELAIDRGMQAVRQATPETASVAKLQWEAERWLAGKLDVEAYGDKPQTAININLGDLHLNALRTINSEQNQ